MADTRGQSEFPAQGSNFKTIGKLKGMPPIYKAYCYGCGEAYVLFGPVEPFVCVKCAEEVAAS